MLRRRAILDASQTLFGRHGLRKVTTDDIAREAHVSKSTIYRFYRNKQEILEDVVRGEMDELLGAIETAVAAESTVEGKLRAHLKTKIEAVHRLINLHGVTCETMAEHWDRADRLRERFLAAETRIVADILSLGAENGSLEIADVEGTAHILVAALRSLEYPWVIEGTNLSAAGQIDTMLNILLNGLRKRDRNDLT